MKSSNPSLSTFALLLGLLSMSSFTALSANAYVENLENVVKEASGVCESKEARKLLGEKVDQCSVTLSEKYPIQADYLCSGVFQVRNDCKLSLIGDTLRTKCVSNTGSLHFNEANLAYPRFFQPAFTLVSKADKAGNVRRAHYQNETETVIVSETSHGQLVIFDQGSAFNANNNRVKAAGFAKSGRRFLELGKFSCSMIE